jgi:hypothetical protein
VYDQDTCYQRLYRTLVTTLVYRKNVMVTQEHWSELARILVPMLMDDGFIYGLDGVPREHKAWRIVDRCAPHPPVLGSPGWVLCTGAPAGLVPPCLRRACAPLWSVAPLARCGQVRLPGR